MRTQDPIRILVVDDNSDLAFIIRESLVVSGWLCVAARNAEETFAVVPTFKPHCILMDLGLPGMDGFEITRELRNFPGLAEIPIIAHTAWDDFQTRIRLRAANFAGHIVKPAGISTIITKVETALSACQ